MSRSVTDDTYAAQVERWTAADWDEYRDRVECGEGSAAAIDAINRRRRRPATTAKAAQ